jgi:hypothetical protein
VVKTMKVGGGGYLVLCKLEGSPKGMASIIIDHEPENGERLIISEIGPNAWRLA